MSSSHLLTLKMDGKLASNETIIGEISDETYLSNIREKLKKSQIHDISIALANIVIDDTKRSFSRCSASQLKSNFNRLRQISSSLPEQRTSGWYKMRETRLTASDLAAALGESAYQTPFEVLKKKCGAGDEFKGNAATEWGVKYESVATKIYEFRKATSVVEFGLLPHQSIPYLGASPDGITPDGVMLEIKCPPRREIDGVVPRHYWIQMQLQLEVCDLNVCDYEECRFEELFSLRDFLECSSTTKGVLIEAFDQRADKPTYFYGPLTIDSSDADISCAAESWLVKTEKMIRGRSGISKVFFRKKVYFHLTKYSCVTVDRDRIWFAQKLPEIKFFWYQVCYYRTQTLDQLYLDFGKKPKATKCVTVPEADDSVCFLESENESDNDDDYDVNCEFGSDRSSSIENESTSAVTHKSPTSDVKVKRKAFEQRRDENSIGFCPESDDD